MPHNHLRDLKTTNVITAKSGYTDAGGRARTVTVKVTWTSSQSSGDAYDAKIEVARENEADPPIDGVTWILSLYTLGVQGRLWAVDIQAGGGFSILTPNGAEMPPSMAKYRVPSTYVVRHNSDPDKFPPDPNGVYFIKFTGSTVASLKVRSKRRRHVQERFDLAEHETAPPPPEPGGEEGDGED